MFVSLSYVRTINLSSPVSLVSVSETLGDIVTVCHSSSQTAVPKDPDHSYNPWNICSNSSSEYMREDVASDAESPSPGVPDDWEILNEAETSKESGQQESTRPYPWSLKGLPKLNIGGSRRVHEPKKVLRIPQHQSVNGSSLSLHSINAVFVGTVNIPEQITAVCFSTAPEGLSVNVIATGLFDGTIRLVICCCFIL